MPSFRALLIALTFAATSSFADTLRVRADSWMPYNGEPNSAQPGYVVELLQEIFQKKGVTLHYETHPWKESLVQAREGAIDAVIGANATEAEGLVLGKESVGEPRMGLFVKKDIQWSYQSIKSLRDVKLGVIEGYSYWESIDQYIKDAKANIHTLSGETPLVDGIELLDTGKIDVIVETFPVFVWTVKNSGRSVANYRAAFKQAGEPIYVAFAPTDKGRAFAAMFDSGVQELRTSGKLEAVLKKYGLTDWTKKD